MENSKKINKRVGWIFVLWRVEFFKISKRDVTSIREMRVKILSELLYVVC